MNTRSRWAVALWGIGLALVVAALGIVVVYWGNGLIIPATPVYLLILGMAAVMAGAAYAGHGRSLVQLLREERTEQQREQRQEQAARA